MPWYVPRYVNLKVKVIRRGYRGAALRRGLRKPGWEGPPRYGYTCREGEISIDVMS